MVVLGVNRDQLAVSLEVFMVILYLHEFSQQFVLKWKLEYNINVDCNGTQ